MRAHVLSANLRGSARDGECALPYPPSAVKGRRPASPGPDRKRELASTGMVIQKGATAAEQAAQIDAWIEELSLDEKVYMLSGHGFLAHRGDGEGRYCEILYPIGAGNARLGIPHLLFSDGPRGIAKGRSTCFPVPMARGASFDVELERRIGHAIGRELRAHGGNLFGGVCINLLRHPAWGRAQENCDGQVTHLWSCSSGIDP